MSDFIEAKLWMLGIAGAIVFVCSFVYRLVTGNSLEESERSDREGS